MSQSRRSSFSASEMAPLSGWARASNSGINNNRRSANFRMDATAHYDSLHYRLLRPSASCSISDKFNRPRTKARAKRLLDNYGLSLDDYSKIEAYQNFACAICHKKTRGRLHVDHAHTSGLVRGLLCPRCNRGIAKFYDSAELLSGAARYLELPPAVVALGREVLGFPGRCGTRRHRTALRRERKLSDGIL